MVEKSNSIKNGIILTGGTGSRLFPMTTVINKHLLNVNDKFIIDYPLQTLKAIGVKNLTVVLGGNNFEQIVEYLKDGSNWGFNINYIYQKEPKGIAQAINLCKPYLLNDNNFVCILGDNLYQYPISNRIIDGKAKVVLTKHAELERFGVATLNNKNSIFSIKEKPVFIDENKRNYAITGCYFLNSDYFNYFNELKLSQRGEYEISEILEKYMRDDNLSYSVVKGWWIDVGTPKAIEEANFILQNKILKYCKECKKNKELEKFFTYNGTPSTLCKECDILRRKSDYYENNERELENKAIYYSNNKNKVINSNNESSKKRRKKDPLFVLRTYASTAIGNALKMQKSSKNGFSIMKFLPYTMEDLKKHLQNQFEPWMNWYNHGKYIKEKWDDNDPSTWTWQLDHIIPQSDLPYLSMEDDNFKKCWALDNLRPYSSKQNILDGTSKIRHNKL